VKSRSAEYLDAARGRLRSAQTLVDVDPSAALSTAYYAALYAARAALSEHDVQARSHRGAWHEFRERFVIDGPIDTELASAMQRLQAEREHADYDAVASPTSSRTPRCGCSRGSRTARDQRSGSRYSVAGSRPLAAAISAPTSSCVTAGP
jgi:uncharacterized protein (UPF0332 family)